MQRGDLVYDNSTFIVVYIRERGYQTEGYGLSEQVDGVAALSKGSLWT